jgi:hypothetical protein
MQSNRCKENEEIAQKFLNFVLHKSCQSAAIEISASGGHCERGAL